MEQQIHPSPPLILIPAVRNGHQASMQSPSHSPQIQGHGFLFVLSSRLQYKGTRLRVLVSVVVNRDLALPEICRLNRTGTKRRRAKPKSRNENIIEESNVTTNIGHDAIGCKRPKREVARSNFSEKAFELSEEDSLVTPKKIRIEEETEAVMLTRTGINYVLHAHMFNR
ncbi:DNA (cytosine-5)-methyltransferase 1A-like [Triticum aestivum]|uniref:DNA (cytosine-5)-methyltransferase 1A-like n=1 Tax=Triticum aestivum TaxID=4565 RepID=UPI001D01FC3C|nr:DNA (cytosine-5)-methyltransferase 1A-like [Triticum aestivum]